MLRTFSNLYEKIKRGEVEGVHKKIFFGRRKRRPLSSHPTIYLYNESNQR